MKKIREAYEQIPAVFRDTPQFVCDSLSTLAKCRILIKVECVNPIRCFKGRRGVLLHAQIQDTGTLVTASAGNFGQAMAYAAKEYSSQSVDGSQRMISFPLKETAFGEALIGRDRSLARVGYETDYPALAQLTLVCDAAGVNDGQLLERFNRFHDEAAFEALVRRHGAMVLGVCRRILRNHHDAEDAFQATFLVLVAPFAVARPQATAANWLYGVAYRTALKAKPRAAKARVPANRRPASLRRSRAR